MRPERASGRRVWSYLAAVPLVGLFGCTTIRPVPLDPVPYATDEAFSHELFGRVLEEFVDDEGRVDYARLAAAPADLDRYVALVAEVSPDSHPERFPTREHALAYWINAYNAAAMRTVVVNYPITSVTDVKGRFPLNVLGGKVGFFLLQRVPFGGVATSLYVVENHVVRKRFRDPRIHFALNCASGGCPRLPRVPFTGPELHAQLEAETRRFLAEERNLRIDHAARTVHLSSILDWYRGDFVEWDSRLPEHATLLDYAALYVPAARADELARATDYEIEFVPYDWALNDQR